MNFRTTITRIGPILLAFLIVFRALPLFLQAAHTASYVPLGRDQGIFQYVAWAILHGERDYADIRDVNGPWTHLVHVAFLLLGGADERTFRVLDLAASGAVFFGVGLVFGLAGERRGGDSSAGMGPIAWGVATLVCVGTQYLLYLWWDLAQRESFCDWLVLPALALAALGQSDTGPLGLARLRSRGPLAAAGLLSGVAVFGKPTYVFFAIAIALGIIAEGDARLSRTSRLVAYTLGGCAGALVMLVVLAAVGDARAFFRLYLVDAPAMYRYIWPKTWDEIFWDPWPRYTRATALVTSGIVGLLAGLGVVPRHYVAVALAPIAGLASVVLQAKNFPYHWHPVTASSYLAWIATAAALFGTTSRGSGRQATRRRVASRAASGALAIALGVELEWVIHASPHVMNPWVPVLGATAEARASRSFLERFSLPDFSPYDLREAAAYVRASTKPEDRVQTYGMDPYVLFLAKRRSATPYIYAYDLNVDAALEGVDHIAPEALVAQKQARIRGLAGAHASDLLARLETSPPAAFVMIDKAPLTTEASSLADLAVHAPSVAAFLEARYDRAATFGDVHVWLRR